MYSGEFSFTFMIMYICTHFPLSQLNTARLQVSCYIKTEPETLQFCCLNFERPLSHLLWGLQMDQEVPESPGGKVTCENRRDGTPAPGSDPRLEPQAMWGPLVFQDLNAPLCPQFWQRIAGALGQTKLHKTNKPMTKT